MVFTNKYILLISCVLLISLCTWAVAQSLNIPRKEQAPNQTSVKREKPVSKQQGTEISLDIDPWKEIENIVQNYYSKEGITYTGKMTLVDDSKGEDKTIEEMEFEYTFLDNGYDYHLGPMDIISIGDLNISVDQNLKTIVVSRARDVKVSPQIFNIEAFKKILTDKKAEVSVSQLNKERIITVDNLEDPTIQGYRLYYDENTYRIHKMEIGMVRLSPVDDGNQAKNQIIDSTDSANDSKGEIKTYTYFLNIVYSEGKNLSLSKEEFHPEKKFIQTDGKTIVLAPAYKDYTLVKAGER